tara:strand:- start:696 stop:1772 length:1077 start_codon:yes stop_codon:yes gene_type:complete
MSLIISPTPSKRELLELGKPALQQMCRERGLSPSGNSTELIERLCEPIDSEELQQTKLVLTVLSITTLILMIDWMEDQPKVLFISILWIATMFVDRHWRDIEETGVFRSRKHEIYWQKRKNLEQFMENNETTLFKFIDENYQKEFFDDSSIRKTDFITRLLFDKLRAEERKFLIDNMRRSVHRTTGRHIQEYAFDIVLGWFSEDLVKNKVKEISDGRLDCELIGVDRNREFSSSSSAEPDLEIFQSANPSNSIRIDVFADWLGTARKQGHLNLKSGKVNRLIDGRTDCVVAIDIESNTYLIFDQNSIDEDEEMTPNEEYGNTPTMSLNVDNSMPLVELISQLETIINMVDSLSSQEEE